MYLHRFSDQNQAYKNNVSIIRPVYVISPMSTQISSDLFLLGATVGLGLEEVYELGLLGDGPLHFHLLMGVHSLQVELSEHHYCHEFLLKYFTSHREGDRGTEKGGGWSKKRKRKRKSPWG